MTDQRDNCKVESVLGNQGITRRKAVKTIAGGVSALAAYHTLPVNWSTPIIEQIFIPAHAQTSGCVGCSLEDPCTAELVSGDQSSSIDVIRVSGIVTPPVGGLEVTIEATPNGGSGGPVMVNTSTASDGTYSAEVTMVGGPGIVGVGVTTSIAGANGVVHCSAGIPPADHPSAQPPQTTQPPTASCSQCGQQLLTDGIGGQPRWNSLLVPYNSNENSYLFSDAASFMTQLVSLSDTCIGSTLRLELGDGGGTGPLRVRLGVGNTVRETTYSGGGLIFEMVVPVGPTSPTVVDIRQASLPFDNTTKIIGPKLTVIC